MTGLEFGLILNHIGMALDDNSYQRIKHLLDRLENGLIDLINSPWTYCDDELPDEAGTYLILWNTDKNPHVYYEIQEFNDGWANIIPQAYGMPHIIAWRELPDIPTDLKERSKK